MTDRNDWILEEMSVNELWASWEEHHDRCENARKAKDETEIGRAVMSIVLIENELIKRGAM